MPLRNMIYDALSLLARQRQKSAKHVALKDLKRPDEFLSRFARTDYLEPVITLVVYFGTPSWDGPLSLHDMIRFPDDVLKRFMPDYFINLVVPAKMGDEMLAKLSTELCEVFGCIRFAGNKENFDAYIIQRPRFREMSYEAVQAINVCTHANIKINHTGEKINMCQAIIDMKKEAYDNGFLKGEESGFLKGEESGFLKGEESMCQAITDMKKEAYNNGFLKGEESGFQTGFQQGKENITSMIALRMYYNKYDLQEIANVTGLATDNIEKLIQAQTSEMKL